MGAKDANSGLHEFTLPLPEPESEIILCHFFFTKELKEEQNCSIESCSHLNESGSHKAPVSECLFPRW